MRSPRKNKVDCGRPEIYRYYKKALKEEAVDRSTHSKVLNAFNKKVSEAILTEAFEYIIPSRLGTLRIKKYKPRRIDDEGNLIKKNLKIDFKSTNELWEKNEEARKNKIKVYHTNDHSDGYEYKWHFSNYRSTCINKSAYCFIPSRTNKRAISLLVKDEEFKGDYYL